MRVLSVVFIFATLAIFGVVAKEDCEVDCSNDPAIEVCASINDEDRTLPNMCHFNNHANCAVAQRRAGENFALVKFLYEGKCTPPTSKDCETPCVRNIDPVCATIDGKSRTFPNGCTYISFSRCAKADFLEEGIEKLVIFEHHGACAGDEDLY